MSHINSSEIQPPSPEQNVSLSVQRLLFAILVLVSLLPIWVPARYPSQNGPWFLLPTQMFLQYDSPELGYSEYYLRNWHPIPHVLHDALVGVVSLAAPVLVAEKLILSLYVFLLPASVFYFLGCVAPGRRELAYLSFLMIHNYPLLRGYHNFTFSIPLFFLTLGYWWRVREELQIRDVVILSVGSVVVYLSHLFTFALLAGTIGWLSLFETRSFVRALRTCLLITWPGWLLTADYLVLNRSATWIRPSDTEWTPFLANLEFFFDRFFNSVSTPAYVIAVSVWLWCLMLLGVQLVKSRSMRFPMIRQILVQPVTSLVIFLVIAYLLLPYKLIGWHKANVRLVPFVLVLMLAGIGQLLPRAFSRRAWLFLLVPTSLGIAAVNLLVAREIAQMDQLVEVYVSGVEATGAKPKLLPIHIENPAFGLVRPLTYAFDHYHLARGGANGNGIGAQNTLSIMWYRQYPVATLFPQYDPTASREEVCRVLKAYDHVLVWGSVSGELSARLEDTGFERIHHRDKLQLFRKRTADVFRPGRAVSAIE